MRKSVIPDFVTLGEFAFKDIRPFIRLVADDKEDARCFLFFQYVQDLRGPAWIRAIIEGDGNLLNRPAQAILGEARPPLPPEGWTRLYRVLQPDLKTPMRAEDLPLLRALRGETVRDVELVLDLGRGQTQFVLDSLPPGPHRVIAVLADWRHIPLNPLIADTVTFTVK